MRKTIFVIDDLDTNLFAAVEALKHKYNVITMQSAEKMFELLGKFLPNLILLDINMPQMNGYEALALLKADNRYENIPVIFLTASQTQTSEVRGFEMGVVDFISKPFSAPVLLNRIKLQLNVSELIEERTYQLGERTKQLEDAHLGILRILADVVENRDKDTGGHLERTTQYIILLVNAMRERGVYSDIVSGWDLELVGTFALLHDVGKIGVSDTILNKPGKLTDDEFEKMKNHVLEGKRIIDKVIDRTGEDVFLTNAKLFALYHHENWDGTGYPYGLSGTDIPIQGRIMAIADVYDALISDRPYKTALTHEDAVNVMRSEAGRRFDPKLIDVFYEIRDKFKAVAENVGNMPQE